MIRRLRLALRLLRAVEDMQNIPHEHGYMTMTIFGDGSGEVSTGLDAHRYGQQQACYIPAQGFSVSGKRGPDWAVRLQQNNLDAALAEYDH